MKAIVHKYLFVAASLSAFGTGRAALVVNGVSTSLSTNNSASAGFATQATYAASVSNSDLINSGRNTLTSAVMDKVVFNISPGLAALNDGLHPASSNGTYLPTTFGSVGKMPFTYTVTLNTSVNTLGYDISSIKSFAGWNQNGSQLANQTYDLYLSTVSGGVFNLVGTVNYSPFTAALGTNTTQAGATMVTVTDDAGLIGSGVSALRFVFKDTVSGVNPVQAGQDGTVYNEVDVIGVATAVPEPSTYGLMGAGALAAAALMRRRRKVA